MNSLVPEYILRGKGEAITDLDFWQSSAPCLLSSYAGGAGVDLWDLKTRRVVLNLPADNSESVLSVAGASNGNIVTLSKEGHLKLQTITDGEFKIKANLCISNVGFCKAAILKQQPSENNLIVGVPGDSKSSFNIWDINQQKIISRLVPAEKWTLGMPMCAKLIMSERLYASIGYEDGSILMWDVNNGKVVSFAERLFSETVLSLDFCDDNIGVCGSPTNHLYKLQLLPDKTEDDFVKPSHFKQLKKHTLPSSGLSVTKIRSDRKIVATGGWDYKVRIFSWKTFKPLAVIDYHKDTIQALAFSNDLLKDQLLACGSNDSKISLWKLYNNS